MLDRTSVDEAEPLPEIVSPLLLSVLDLLPRGLPRFFWVGMESLLRDEAGREFVPPAESSPSAAAEKAKVCVWLAGVGGFGKTGGRGTVRSGVRITVEEVRWVILWAEKLVFGIGLSEWVRFF